MNDIDKMPGKCHDCAYWEVCEYPYVCPIPELPNNSPELSDNSIEVFVKGKRDTISRQEAYDAVKQLLDDIESICADLRERHVDNSVCGLCEYDGAYMGESGNWCNECPGFDRDDCFKLKEEYRQKWLAKLEVDE